jgi:threonine dehydratase
MPDTALPTYRDIEAARRRIAGEAVVTPLLEFPVLNRAVGGRALVKPECLQRTGSFKFRGAWNRVSQLADAQLKGGVVAFSSGNHAQGVAAAAKLRGMPAVIVMPADTPMIKQANTRGYGAEVKLYDRATQSREEIAGRIARERGAALVPPFDHPQIIAGQGTAGAEIAEQASAKDARLDIMLCGASGGGLLAGVALALAELSPATRVYSVEPEGFDDHRRSLASGRRERNPSPVGSICDALLSPEPGEITFAMNAGRLAGGLAVSEAEVKAAMRFAFAQLKLVVEPGGAVSLAALLSGKIDCRGKTVGVMLSGGNVDPAVYAAILAEGD